MAVEPRADAGPMEGVAALEDGVVAALAETDGAAGRGDDALVEPDAGVDVDEGSLCATIYCSPCQEAEHAQEDEDQKQAGRQLDHHGQNSLYAPRGVEGVEQIQQLGVQREYKEGAGD